MDVFGDKIIHMGLNEHLGPCISNVLSKVRTTSAKELLIFFLKVIFKVKQKTSTLPVKK